MGREVVHGDFHTLALFELAQGVRQQVEVKGVGVVKVVVVSGSLDLLFSRKDLGITAGGPSFLRNIIEEFVCFLFVLAKCIL